MILKKISEDLESDLLLDQHQFKVISDHINLNHIQLDSCEGILINTDQLARLDTILSVLRSSDLPSVYLKPVFVTSKKLYLKRKYDIDGYTQNKDFTVMLLRSSEINLRIKSIRRDINKIANLTEVIIIKALQYCYTRKISFTPYPSRFSSIGYSVPYLHSVMNDQNLISLFKKLDEFQSKSILTSEILDRVNLCHDCLGSYLNFHETCNKCNSLDLKYESLIHHFRCAFIGPESDFIHGDDLICPKCDKSLKHIGIDYDKPSEIASCNHCNHTSQETKMEATCVDCGSKNTLNQLSTQDINKYELTSLGEQWICNANTSDRESDIQLKDLSIVPLQIFNLLLEQEKIRARQSGKIGSFTGELSIDEHVFLHLNIDFREKLRGEIMTIMKSYLRKIDVLTSESFTSYKYLLPDIKLSDAKATYEIILDNLNKILSDNIPSKQNLIKGTLIAL